MGYDLEGRMHEVCSCATYCPCWAGLDPDGGTCGFSWIFHVDRGQVNDVDVTGLNMGFIGHLPGNVFGGDVRLKVLVDERADGTPSTLRGTALAPVLGDPAYPAQVVTYRMSDHGLGFTPGGATQTEFHYVTT